MSRLDDCLRSNPRAAHLVGCCGAGMRSLAEYWHDLGWTLSGSDAAASPRMRESLERIGVAVLPEHASRNLTPAVELVVSSPAVPESNPERSSARERGIPEVLYPEVLGALSRSRPTIAIAGTHGKSTTTGLVATALSEAGQAGAVFCGAEILEKHRHGWAGPGPWAVMEACEYRRHFLEISPQIAVVLSIEPDHFDCFPDLGDAVAAYSEFLAAVPPSGKALVNMDFPAARSLGDRSSPPLNLETMSATGLPADWEARSIQPAQGSLALEVWRRGEFDGRVQVPLCGRHHAANLLAAYAVLRVTGLTPGEAAGSLSRFQGLSRRLERWPEWRGVTRLDDYAHHPTAVRAVLEAVRHDFISSSQNRLVAVFQPHQIIRTERLWREFAAALGAADVAIVVPVYAAREQARETALQWARQIVEATPETVRATMAATLDHARLTLETALRPGDVLVTLGAGDIDCLHYELSRRFP